MNFKLFYLFSSLFVNKSYKKNYNIPVIDSYYIPDEVWKKHFGPQKLKNSTITDSDRV